MALLLVGLLATACGGDSAAERATATPEERAGQVVEPVPATPAFESDPQLRALIAGAALGLPARFVEVPRDDLEPILSLGLASAAARLMFSSATTGEVLIADVLLLEADVDAEAFFAEFAAALADNPGFAGVREVGVPRGVGEEARHYSFTVDGDPTDAATLLRGEVVVLFSYRWPEGLREPLDVGALLRLVDGSVRRGGSARGGG